MATEKVVIRHCFDMASPFEEWEHAGTLWHGPLNLGDCPAEEVCSGCAGHPDDCICLPLVEYIPWDADEDTFVDPAWGRALVRLGLEPVDPYGDVGEIKGAVIHGDEVYFTPHASMEELKSLPVGRINAWRGGSGEHAEMVLRSDLAAMVVPLSIGAYNEVRSVGDPARVWDEDIEACVYISQADIDKEFDGDPDKAGRCLVQEAEVYALWTAGDVWSFEVVQEDGTVTDSCHGFIGGTLEESGILDYLDDDALEASAREAWEHRFDESWEPDWDDNEEEYSAPLSQAA